MVAHAQLGQVGQLLDANDGVVERGLQRLGHGVGQDYSDHHRQDVGDLTRQLEHDHGGGYGVGDCSRQRGCTYVGGEWIKGKKKPFYLVSSHVVKRLGTRACVPVFLIGTKNV